MNIGYWCYILVMGDNHPCIMQGVGTIQIKMFDGMIRELKKVRYVPQLKRNLISIGDLETLGLTVSIKKGVLKMTKGSMVVLKAVRRNNLYYLKGNIVTGKWQLLLIQMKTQPGYGI